MKLNGSIIILVALGLLSCASNSFLDGKPKEKGPLTGMIYDRDRQSVSSAKIQVFFPGVEKPLETQTDINGRFSIAEAPYGSLKVTISKPLYETFSVDFPFTTQSQVLYAQVIHRNSLVELGTVALQTGEWEQARNLQKRAQILDPQYPDIVFLEVYILIHDEKYKEAVARLEGLIQRSSGLYPAYLALVDIYEFKLKDIPFAVEALKKALLIRSQPEWEERLKKLES